MSMKFEASTMVVKKAYVRKEVRVYFAIGLQIGIVACMTEENDQKDVVEMPVVPTGSQGRYV